MWTPPGRNLIRNRLLDGEYNSTMGDVKNLLHSWLAMTFMSDGVSNVNKHSLHNNLVCSPTPVFIEYSRFNLAKETSANVAKKILDSRCRVLNWVHPELEDEEKWLFDILKGDQKIQKPPNGVDRVSRFMRMSSYCSDSCNQMIAARNAVMGRTR